MKSIFEARYRGNVFGRFVRQQISDAMEQERIPITNHFHPALERNMTEDQIKHMVDRFLCWRLPDSFNPDGGISFKNTFNEHTAHPMKHEPIGTNLFDATQAAAMVRYMVEGLPAAPSPS